MKSKIIGRRQLLIGTLAVSFCLAVFVNWYYTKPDALKKEGPQVTEEANLGEAQYVNGDKVTEENDYFLSAKLNRSKAHDNAKSHLESIISDENTDEEMRKKAQEELINISSQIKIEADIENLIFAQQGGACLVTLSEKNVEIIMPKGSINEDILIKIKDIVISKTALPAENITVIELK